MSRIILVIIMLYAVVNTNAQQAPEDSIINLLQHYTKQDTMRLNLLTQLASAYAESDIEKGIATADEAILLAEKLNVASKTGKAYFSKALNYMSDENYRQVLVALSFAVNAFNDAKDSFNLARCYFGNGLAYFNLSAYDSAIMQQQKALSIYTTLGEQKKMANCLNSIGANYRNLSAYANAIDYYLKALSIYEATKSNNETAMALSNVGMIYKDIEDYPHALQYYEKANTIYKQTNDKAGIAKTLTNIGIAYDGMENNEKALSIFLEALQLNESLGLKTEVSSNLSSVGIIYFDRKEYEKALPYFKKALDISAKLDNKRSIGILTDYLGALYLNCSESLLLQESIKPANRMAKALAYQTISLKLAKESGSLYEQSTSLFHLSNTYESMHDYKSSLEYYKQYVALKDSVFNESNTKEITKKEMEYEFEKRQALSKAASEKKQALAEAEINRQRVMRNALISGAAILLLGAITSFLFYKRRRDAENQKTTAEFNAQVADTEMKALRAQMNPHFIFNSLNSIGDYISRNDIKNANNYLSKFAKVMRMILEHSEQKEVPLADDLKALELYMQLESARMNNKFSYEINVTEDIDIENTLVPPLILQPFVENSIWHGLSKKNGEGKIIINISKQNNMLYCSVEDNGVGREITKEITAEKRSLGMKITKARIDIINKLKKSSAGVMLTDLAEGTKVELQLPLELSF